MRVGLQAFNNGVYEISSLSILSKAYVFSKMSTLSLQVHLMKREKVALQTVQENIKYFFCHVLLELEPDTPLFTLMMFYFHFVDITAEVKEAGSDPFSK